MKRTMPGVYVAAIFLIGQPLAAQTTAPASLDIRTLSTRPETVSGGEVLVQITVPRNVGADRISVALIGRDVRAAFRPGIQPQTLAGLVTDLNVGSNQIRASAPGERRAQITIVNHPLTGPVIAGPHQTPFVCETEAFGLGPALDGNCSVSTRVDYFYRVRAPASPQLESPAASSAAALARLERPAALQLWWRMPGRLATLDPVTDPSRCQVMFPVAANPRLVIAADAGQTEMRAEGAGSSGL